MARRNIKTAYHEIQDAFDAKSLWRRNGTGADFDDARMKERRIKLQGLCNSKNGLEPTLLL